MKKWTPIFIVTILVAIFVYDVVAIYFGGKEASISSYIIVYSYAYPAGTFLMGFIFGHLFWRLKPNKDTVKIDK